jgi:2-phospho-L-lactate guanylyltransferase (CobY/MobA/RfbA family)
MNTRQRITPRQAVVVLDIPPQSESQASESIEHEREDLQPYALLDVIGTLVGVSGASISVMCRTQARARMLRQSLPAGIDVIVPEPVNLMTGGALLWSLQSQLNREFSRVVAIAGDALAVPTRVVATALGSLAEADLVLGQTFQSGVYLVGVRNQTGITLLLDSGAAPNWERLDPRILREHARQSDAVIRQVESKARLSEYTSSEMVRQVLRDAAALAPRLTAALAGESFTPPA